MKIPPSSIPLQIARAYAAAGPNPAQPAPPAQPIGRIDRFDGQQARDPSGADRLVAGAVPGRVEFDDSGAARPALSIYSSPAERNTAATGVALGRTIDVSG